METGETNNDEEQNKPQETETNEDNTGLILEGEHQGSDSTKDENSSNAVATEMNKPWPPLLAEFAGKPRSYSDTSPRRAVEQEIKKDIRSCTSYMHLPHISGMKILPLLPDESPPSPHLHQSFSRMHLPHFTDPDNDFSTVSVIALAEERDRDSVGDVISDDIDDVKDSVGGIDVEDVDGSGTSIQEHAIYVWDRDKGRTRSLSEPPALDSLSDVTSSEQRPRSMSLESADKAKKIPARLQFQMTLGELEEESAIATDTESDIENQERTSSILVLAESAEMSSGASHAHSLTEESESQDEILARWTRHEPHPTKKASFSTDLGIIPEHREATDAHAQIRTKSAASVLQLVDEVTKDIMDRTPTDSMAEDDNNLSDEEIEIEESVLNIDPRTFWRDGEKSARMVMRRSTVASTSPLRESHIYATEIERQAFHKISQWKTDFALKLDDVLSKGIQSGHSDDDKDVKLPVRVLDVPMNLSPEQLSRLRGSVITELRNKPEVSRLRKTNAQLHDKPSRHSPDKTRRVEDTKQVVKETKHLPQPNHPEQEAMSSELHGVPTDTRGKEKLSDDRRPSHPSIDKNAMSKDKIVELVEWHDKERERLLLGMKKTHILHSVKSPLQVVVDSSGLEKVFRTLQVTMDSIFRETILRLTSKRDIDENETTSETTVESHRDDEMSSMKRDEEAGTVKKSEGQPKVKAIQRVGITGNEMTQVKPRKPVKSKGSPEESQRKQASRIPVPNGKTMKITNTRPPKTRDIKHKNNINLFLPTHVHTTSVAEHICHRDTCAGMADESSPSCECDSASDETETTDIDLDASTDETTLTGTDSREYTSQSKPRPEVFPGSSSTATEEFSPSDSSSPYHSTPLTSREPSTIDQDEEMIKPYQHFSDESQEESELDYEESDACSEIADLLGVYQVFNATTDKAIAEPLARPQAPEHMTYEEKDLRDKVKSQKAQLKKCKRIIREFHAKNKRKREEKRHLHRQVHELHGRCTEKETRISELKKQTDHMTATVESLKKALEDRKNIIKMKDKQILKIILSDTQGQDDQVLQLQQQLTNTLEENHQLTGKLVEKTTCDKAAMERQADLELANKRILELEGCLQESNKQITELNLEKELMTAGEKDEKQVEGDYESKKYFKNTVCELTKKIYEVMSERDKLETLLQSEESETKKHLEEKVSQLEKMLREAEVKHGNVDESIVSSLEKKLHEYEGKHKNDCKLLFDTQIDYKQFKASTSNAMDQKDEEITSLKTSLSAFQSLTQKLTEERRAPQEDDKEKESMYWKTIEYQTKLEDMTRSAEADHSSMETALKESVAERKDEENRHQQTLAGLQEANQRLCDINARMVAVDMDGNTKATMKKQQQVLQDENSALKRRLKEEERSHSSVLIEITELQGKLVQRDCEIKELRRTQEDLRQQVETDQLLRQIEIQASQRPSHGTRETDGRGLSAEKGYPMTGCGNKYNSLAQRCARQWEEESDLHQQELDELRKEPNKSPKNSEELVRLTKGINDMKKSLDDFMRTQNECKIIARDEIKEKLEVTVKEMERQERFYKQLLDTKESSHAEIAKEKNSMIQLLGESKSFLEHRHSGINTEELSNSLKAVVEQGISQQFNELQRKKENLPYGVIADSLSMTETVVKRLEESSEQAWESMKQDLSELKDFTFEMADAMEKDLFSSQEQFTEVIKYSAENVIKCVKDESNAVKESFLEGMESHDDVLVDAVQAQEAVGVARLQDLLASLDGLRRHNDSEAHQVRRDVLLAAEAVANSAEELQHIKDALLNGLPTKDVTAIDERTRDKQMVGKEIDIKELRKNATEAFAAAKTLRGMEHEYADKAKSLALKERQLNNSPTSPGSNLGKTAALASQEGSQLSRFIPNLLRRATSTGNASEDELRQTHRYSYSAQPSRDHGRLSLRERLERRAEARGNAESSGSTGSAHHTRAGKGPWSSEKPSSFKS